MKPTVHVKEPYCILWVDGGEELREGFTDAGAVNERLNELWTQQSRFGAIDPRRARAFLSSKLGVLTPG